MPMSPLPGLPVRYPRQGGKGIYLFGTIHDARPGRENVRSAWQRNDILVQAIPCLPYPYGKPFSSAVATGKDMFGKLWMSSAICAVLSSLSLDGRGSRSKKVLEK